jgi:hypothetical protein
MSMSFNVYPIYNVITLTYTMVFNLTSICSVCPNHYPALSSFVAYNRFNIIDWVRYELQKNTKIQIQHYKSGKRVHHAHSFCLVFLWSPSCSLFMSCVFAESIMVIVSAFCLVFLYCLTSFYL